jgi:tRNA-specific 2-thiouridylase
MKKRVLAAISGGVDSAVAARLALESNHEVVGVTMRLWGGKKQSRSCSTADADEAANVARSLQIEHIV